MVSSLTENEKKIVGLFNEYYMRSISKEELMEALKPYSEEELRSARDYQKRNMTDEQLAVLTRLRELNIRDRHH